MEELYDTQLDVLKTDNFKSQIITITSFFKLFCLIYNCYSRAANDAKSIILVDIIKEMNNLEQKQFIKEGKKKLKPRWKNR